jgi:predicted short-subunit dehydrogenase-like oxidoreductase (DUF2520 family)
MPRSRRKLRLRVFILGAGKVGVALARVLRERGARVELRAARAGVPARPIDADLLVLAVRDRDLLPLATKLADARLVRPRTACVHVAGGLTAEAIAPLRAVSAGVAQMHPMISFASREHSPRLDTGNMHISGDPAPVELARKLARAIGMVPRTIPGLDTIGYHAAAGLVANGAAALAAIGARVLEAAGVPADVAPAMLGPLLQSVADNVSALAFPDALTGPVRRGDPQAVRRHLEMFEKRMPDAVPLFLASALAQLPLAREIGEAAPEGYDAIEALLTAKWSGISRPD